ILVPLSIMWAYRPVREVPDELKVSELFLTSPADLPVCMPPADALDALSRNRWVNWRRVFTGIDRAIKLIDTLRIRPFRRMAVNRASRWMLERLADSDGLGAIFPPIIWSVVALRCLGYEEESPEVRGQLGELEKLCIREGDSVRLQPCKSPVWDTAIASIALREAGVDAGHPSLRKSVEWLLSKEVRRKGDWTADNVGHKAGGWFFEFENAFYPDVDDTCMVVMALRRCLPEAGTADLNADFLLGDWSTHPADRDASTVLAGRTSADSESSAFGLAALLVNQLTPQLNAIWRGARWLLAMQNRDGGWGAFDRDNNRELFTQVPFADHNAMIDPSSADLTGRMLEMFADLNVSADFPPVRKALNYVWNTREPDHTWYGRWGVNYLYGTWQTLVGLGAIGIPACDERIRQAAKWLKSVQQENGGWGESPKSYDEPRRKGRGPATASQTAWALMGLMAADETDSESVRRGIDYLVGTQKEDGTWDEPWFTGTGFPKVFYLKYHLYRIYFPLMALGRYARLTADA
ncbi:MAG: prenyltransferase/squalene oxidase repeat-containing protein, partial [Planctomycetaceae bacterium]